MNGKQELKQKLHQQELYDHLETLLHLIQKNKVEYHSGEPLEYLIPENEATFTKT